MSLLKKPLINRISARVQSLEVGRPYVASEAGKYLTASMIRDEDTASFENVGVNGLGVCRTAVEVALGEANTVQALRYTESIRHANGSELLIVEFGGEIDKLGVIDISHAAIAIRGTVAACDVGR